MIISFTPLRGPTRFFDINKEQEVIKDNTPAPIKTTVIKRICEKDICKHLTKPPKKLRMIRLNHKNLAGVVEHIKTYHDPDIMGRKLSYKNLMVHIMGLYNIYAVGKGVTTQRKSISRT